MKSLLNGEDRKRSARRDSNRKKEILQLGNELGMVLPKQIVIFAIKIKDVTTFSETCSPEVEHAIPVAADMVIQELERCQVLS